MAARDARVDAYIAKAAHAARPVLEHIRAIVHAGCPEVEETIKWGFPHFMYKGMLCSMAAFTSHCALTFWKGALLGVHRDGQAMGQFGRIASIADLPSAARLTRIVRKAAALNDNGVALPRARAAPKPVPDVPADLLAALRRNKQALATFNAFPPSHKREYAEWITEAKRDQTRKRRVEAAAAMIAAGHTRNAKYAAR
jgi:uncharacterized protein YdeI (YjbR/CyaY-like superfamily)